MRRSSQLAVIDRRIVLRGMAATLAATLVGCRISLDSSPRGGGGGGGGGDDGPDAGMAQSSHTGDGGVTGDAGSGTDTCAAGQLCLDLTSPDNADLTAVDGARIVTFEGKSILVVRTSETTFAALSAVCTHAGCLVRYAPTAQDVSCPCHGSLFALDGSVLRGPAELPLAQYPTSFDPRAQVVTVAI
jgi:cytochrome b6-f complex iron-sulfur subunit